jgi:Raf kinase inhibitor-like YbhB/YbcL family protein
MRLQRGRGALALAMPSNPGRGSRNRRIGRLRLLGRRLERSSLVRSDPGRAQRRAWEKRAVELTSGAFASGQPVPRRHSCEGDDLSPPVAWSGVPAGAVSLALIVDDPDAPGGTFTHWVAWGIGPQDGGLAEGQRAPREGRNDFREVGYRGPCPPRGDGVHRYSFRLHALASEPAVPAGAGRNELERAIEGSIVAVAELVGTYRR